MFEGLNVRRGPEAGPEERGGGGMPGTPPQPGDPPLSGLPLPPRARFDLGRVVITPSVLEILRPGEIMAALARHQSGEWGELDAMDRCANEHALKAGLRLLSVYQTERGEPFWIITEADRRATTLMLPDDY
jgi:hypothetical protein